MALEYLAADRKPEPCSHNVSLHLFSAVVAVEDLGQELLGDALAVVDDLYSHAAGLVHLSYADALVVAAVVYGIVYEIIEHLVDLCGICPDDPVLIGDEADVVALFLYEQRVSREDIVYLVVDGELGKIQLQVSAFQLRELKYIVHQLREPVRFLDDDIEMLVPLFGIISREIAYHLGIGFYHSQRSSQVVGDIRYEVRPQLADLLDLDLRLVQHRRKLFYLPVALCVELHVEISCGEFLGGLGHIDYGLRKPLGDEHCYYERQLYQDDGYEDKMLADDADRGIYGLHSSFYEDVVRLVAVGDLEAHAVEYLLAVEALVLLGLRKLCLSAVGKLRTQLVDEFAVLRVDIAEKQREASQVVFRHLDIAGMVGYDYAQPVVEGCSLQREQGVFALVFFHNAFGGIRYGTYLCRSVIACEKEILEHPQQQQDQQREYHEIEPHIGSQRPSCALFCGVI